MQTKTNRPRAPRTVPKPAVRYCEAGHRQPTGRAKILGCLTCDRAAIEAQQLHDDTAPLVIPDVLIMRCGTGEIITCGLPRGMKKRPSKRRR